jgi:hypothetical protein
VVEWTRRYRDLIVEQIKEKYVKGVMTNVKEDNLLITYLPKYRLSFEDNKAVQQKFVAEVIASFDHFLRD